MEGGRWVVQCFLDSMRYIIFGVFYYGNQLTHNTAIFYITVIRLFLTL